MARKTHKNSRHTPAETRVTDRLHQSAYSYYSAAHATSGDGSLSTGTRRLLSAALLSSASLLALGSGSTSAHAGGPCITVGTAVTCSGNSANGQVINGNNLNVTADGTFVQDTSANMAGAPGANTGISLTGDSGTITNNGTITVGETGTNAGQHHGISATTTTVTGAYNFGTINNNGANASAVHTFGAANSTAINRAGGTLNLGATFARGVTAQGTANATARNYGTISGTVSQHVGVYASAQGGEATASNSGTINIAGDGNIRVGTIGIGAAAGTVNLNNTGNIALSGNYAAGIFGLSTTENTTNITNSGTVSAATGTSVGIIGIGPTVNITNTASGVVTGGANAAGIVFVPTNHSPGMTIVGGTATVINNGTVNGDVTSTSPGNLFLAPTLNSATVTNTGTINGAIRTDGGMTANITNNGGTVGDNTTAIATGGADNDRVTITGSGNVINGSIINASKGGSTGNVLTFSQSDVVRLTRGQSDEYGGFYSVRGFDEVRFTGGTTEFVGTNFFAANFFGMGYTGTTVTVGPGATFKASGGTTTFGHANEGIKFGGTLNATGAGTRRATVEVPAGGRLNFTGDVTFGDKGRFKVGIAGQNNAGYLQGNNITFNAGSEIYADLTRGIQLTDDVGIKVANATDTLTDNGAAVYDNSALVSFTKSVVGNDLFLIPKRGIRAVPASGNNQGTSNALNIAAAIDAFIDTAPTDNPIVQYLARFPVEQQEAELAKLVQDTLPDESGSTGAASVASTDMVIDLIMSRLSGGGFNVVDSGQGTGQTGVAAGELFLGTEHNLALWGRAGGSFAEFTPSGVSGFDSNTYAISLGLDGDVTSQIRAGGALFYSTTDVDETGATANSGQQIEGVGFLAYATYRPEDWYVNGTVGFGKNRYKNQRTAAGGLHTASFGGEQLMTRLEAGRIFTLDDGAWDITPHVGLNANKVWIDGYTESGPVPTTINSMNITSVRAVAGVAARYTHELDNGSRFLPEGYVRALQELADPGQPISGSVVGGGTFISSPTKRDKFSTGVGAGLTYEFTDVFSVRLLYDGEFQDDYREDSVTAAVRLEF